MMSHQRTFPSTGLAILLLVSTYVLHGYGAGIPQQDRCRNIPGDVRWPDSLDWDRLNTTVSNRLISTVPVGAVCHEPHYDEMKCEQLKQNWGLASVDVPRPADFMSLWFQNNTCTPFTDKQTKCELGNYATHSINVSTIEDIRAGLAFARKHNIRLVVKNSGHDFYGASTGLGSLSLWMHHLNNKEFITHYQSTFYRGPAMRIQTGVQGADAANFAADKGYSLVVGTCPTVKPAGGYLAGGGHGYLSGKYGFGADNVLEWEVVTTDGRHLTVTPTRHPDLYWALSGGGGGTFAVVLSATIRVFANEPVAMATLSFNASQTGGDDQYWSSVSTFQNGIKLLLDQGMMAEYFITRDTFTMVGLVKSGNTSSSLRQTLAPVLMSLTQSNTSNLTAQSLNLKYASAKSYRDLYAAKIEPTLQGNVFGPTVAGRLIPRETLDQNSTGLHLALRKVAERGYYIAVVAFNTSNPVRNRLAPRIAANAVQPAINNAFASVMLSPAWSNSMPWSRGQELQTELMDEVLPVLQAATPGGGAYKNEANWAENNLKESFYGDTYERLDRIKRKWDPQDTLYGITSVGSDRWTQDGRGRLCRTDAA